MSLHNLQILSHDCVVQKNIKFNIPLQSRLAVLSGSKLFFLRNIQPSSHVVFEEESFIHSLYLIRLNLASEVFETYIKYAKKLRGRKYSGKEQLDIDYH